MHSVKRIPPQRSNSSVDPYLKSNSGPCSQAHNPAKLTVIQMLGLSLSILMAIFQVNLG